MAELGFFRRMGGVGSDSPRFSHDRSGMTNRIFTGPMLAIALLAVLLLIASGDRPSFVDLAEAPGAAESAQSEQVAESPGLFVCDPPELKPIERPAIQPAMRPVAYPGEALAAGTRGDRPFAPVDPQLPLPPGLKTRPRVVAVQPSPDLPSVPPPAPFAPANEQALGAPGPAERLARRPLKAPPRGTAPGGRMALPRRPPAVPAAQNSEAMRAVTRQVEEMIRRGYHLAERGALYSGRAEFIQALSTIAQALDLQAGGRRHTEALAAGLTALEEAEDFIPSGSGLETDLDLPTLLRAHHTPICKQTDTSNLLPVTLLQQYYTYAQDQLARASGGQEAASMAMLWLGKTYSTLALEKSLPAAVAEPKAMVFHWAALSTHGGNFLAANELAVLEARWGQLATARSLLLYSLSVLPHSAVWRNLSTVHQRLDETQLAELALREADIAAKREAAAKLGNSEGIVPSSDVQWLDTQTFASTSRSEIDPQRPLEAADQRQAAPAASVTEPSPPRQRAAAAWFPWIR